MTYFIAKEHMNINGAQIRKGQRVFTSTIKGGGTANKRIQHDKSRQSTFATVIWAAYADKFEKVSE